MSTTAKLPTQTAAATALAAGLVGWSDIPPVGPWLGTRQRLGWSARLSVHTAQGPAQSNTDESNLANILFSTRHAVLRATVTAMGSGFGC